MAKDLVTWLTRELHDRGWSYSELARRAGLDSSTISLVLSEQRNPGFEFCVKVADALGEHYTLLLEKADLVPDSPPSVHEETEVIDILRNLDPVTRQTALAMLRGLKEERKENHTSRPTILDDDDFDEKLALISAILPGLEAIGKLAEVKQQAEAVLRRGERKGVE